LHTLLTMPHAVCCRVITGRTSDTRELELFHPMANK
jgi:hypothetical protein